jgi:hypothetical protein
MDRTVSTSSLQSVGSGVNNGDGHGHGEKEKQKRNLFGRRKKDNKE